MNAEPQVQAFRDRVTGSVSYLVLCPDCGECALLDVPECGDVDARVAQIVSYVRRNGLTLRWLADTGRGAPAAEQPARQLQQVLGGRWVGGARPPARRYDLRIADGDELPLGESGLKVLHTPGASPDSLSYALAGHVFVGELLSLDAAARPVPAAAGGAVDASLRRLLALPPETEVLVGITHAPRASLSVAELRQVFGACVSGSPADPGCAPH